MGGLSKSVKVETGWNLPSDNPTECAVIEFSTEFIEGEDESVVEMNFTVERNQDMEENGINQEFYDSPYRLIPRLAV